MRAYEVMGEIDAQRRLQVLLPRDAPEGRARVLVLVPEGDDADAVWMDAIAREWGDELADEREDVYSLEDGEPPHDAGPPE